MRKITGSAIAAFSTLTGLEIAAAYFTNEAAVVPLVAPDFRGLTIVGGTILLFYVYAILSFRLMHRLRPFPSGEIDAGSKDEQRAFVYLLFHLMVFNPLLFTRVFPVPMMRLVLQALGARFGANSFSVGIVMDPLFLTVGKDSIIGNNAMVISHVIEGDKFGFYPIKIGNRVTVGAGSIVMAGVEVGDDATIAVQSVVSKGTTIAAGETWGGTPARRLRARAE